MVWHITHTYKIMTYIIQKSSTRPNGWVPTDKEHGIVATLDDGKYNDRQKVK